MTTYYIDPTNGLDTNDGLSIETAFNSIQVAADLTNPGDTVYLLNGIHLDTNYDSNILLITRSGTPDAWITYKAYPGHSPILQSFSWHGILIIDGASYIEINGLELIGNNANITLEYALSEKDNPGNPLTNGSGITVDGRYGDFPHHIRILNNKVYNFGGGGIATIQADYITIDGNEVFNNAWYSVYANSGISNYQNWRFDDNTGYKMFITNNKSYNNRQYIPWLYGGGIISDGNGIILDDSINSQNNSTLGAYTGRTLVRNNLVYNNGGSGIHSFASEHIDIINNTAYLNNQSPELVNGQIYAIYSNDINISYNILVAPPDKYINTNFFNTNYNFDNNVFFGSNLITVQSPTDIVADPQFINPSQANFRLQPGSPATGKGVLFDDDPPTPTPNPITEFYNSATLFTISKPIYFLLDNDYLRELTNSGIPNYQTIMNIENRVADNKIVIKVHKAEQANLNSFSPLKQWLLASVWYDGNPCMIIRNKVTMYSLKQDSYPKHFITDVTTHKAMLYYILSFMEEDIVIDKSVRNQGVWNRELLYGDRVLKEPQVLVQPKVYDMQLAELAINL